MQVAGIILQLIAGFSFIFVQDFPKRAENIRQRLRSYRDTIAGDPRNRRIFNFIISLVVLSLSFLFIFIYGTSELTTWEIVGTLVFYLIISVVFGYNAHFYFLRLLSKGKFNESINNFLLLLVSAALITIWLFNIGHLASNQNLIIQAFTLLILLISIFAIFPVSLTSLAYLLVTGMLNIHRIPKWIGWTFMLTTWTTGGIFLAITAP